MIVMVVFKICTGGKDICVSTPIYPSDNIRLVIEDQSTLGKIKALALPGGVKSTDSVSG